MKKKLIIIIASILALGIIIATSSYYKGIAGDSDNNEKEVAEESEEKTDKPILPSVSIVKDKEDSSKENAEEETSPEIGEAKGHLSVSGTSLINENGETVLLKGLSTHGMAWYPDYINKNLFTELKEVWNCDIVRLAMYTEEYGGYCSGGDKKNLLSMIDNGVSYATELDMYVIIDWHILSDGNPNKNKSDAIEFFKTVSDKYKDNEHVIYEICNEPNGGTAWKDIKSYALEVIPVIRANSPDSIIIVGTPTWSQEVDKAAADPITEYDNIMYALHFYADTHKDSLRKTLESAVKKGLPIFVTEYGICDASGNGAINAKEADKWMELLDSYNISSCAWNISNKSETSAIFKSSCSKKYGFTESDLSDSGKWVFNMLTGKTTYDSGSVSFETTPETKNENDNSSSKTVVSQTGPVSITLTSTGSWESEGKTFTQYTITVTNNNSFDIDSWTGEVVFDSSIELSQGWCADFKISGNKLTISNVDFNGYIKAGESTKDVGCIIIE